MSRTRANGLEPSPSGGRRVLVVDDEPALRRALARGLLELGFAVDTAEGGAAALDLLRARPVDVVLLDHDMPEMGGPAVLAQLSRARQEVEAIVMVSPADHAARATAIEAGAYEVIVKPVLDFALLAHLLQRAVERRSLVRRLQTLQAAGRQEADDLVAGTSRVMQDLQRRATAAASSACPVLILGERGTGKTLLARGIHRQSNRCEKQLVQLNVSGLPPEAADRELFGAVGSEGKTKPGGFELCEGGSLVLEEVEHMPSELQAKLAGALATGEIRPVGANEGRATNARLIATSHSDLRTLVRSGRFREDLFFRLGVILLELPPLRARREDIPVLAYHLLRASRARVGKDVRRISADALRALRDHTWPGNVTELAAAMQQAAAVAQGDTILSGDLRLGVLDGGPGSTNPAGPLAIVTGDLAELPYADAKDRAVEAFDRGYVEWIMGRCGGNISEAARHAGMDRSNFRRLLKKLHGRRSPGTGKARSPDPAAPDSQH